MNTLSGFFSRYAKAMVPVILASAGVAQHWIEAGTFDRAALGGVVAGAITALAVALVPNSPPRQQQQ